MRQRNLVSVTISSAFGVHNANRSIALALFANPVSAMGQPDRSGPEPKDELPG
jgi:hypothetical protein